MLNDNTLLQSAAYVIERASHVSLDTKAVKELADRLAPQYRPHWLESAPNFVKSYWASRTQQNRLLFLTIFHTIGFCYWSSEPHGKRWIIKPEEAIELEEAAISKTKYLCTQVSGPKDIRATERKFDGAAALLISMASNANFLDLDYLADLDFEQFKTLLAGQRSQNIESLLLLNERHSLITNLAKKLLGSREIIGAKLENISATELAQKFADELPGFDDSAYYKGRKIYFLKRAQLLVSDINQVLPISKIEELTAFADYKLPQILRHHKVITYEPALAERIDSQVEVLPGSEEEVEIRAATIIAIELIKERLEQAGNLCTAAQIDSQLWLLAKAIDKSQMQPYHRCRTICY